MFSWMGEEEAQGNWQSTGLTIGRGFHPTPPFIHVVLDDPLQRGLGGGVEEGKKGAFDWLLDFCCCTFKSEMRAKGRERFTLRLCRRLVWEKEELNGFVHCKRRKKAGFPFMVEGLILRDLPSLPVFSWFFSFSIPHAGGAPLCPGKAVVSLPCPQCSGRTSSGASHSHQCAQPSGGD